ncbi:hypothetical protein ABZ249_17155 [Nocardiopsis sp. NPDC006139]|uniref:hypothetical protein n=1 Tax=Nocardiopsis sp. NPDC006139 TaxID=3154578 RepID=UPI0033A0D06C
MSVFPRGARRSGPGRGPLSAAIALIGAFSMVAVTSGGASAQPGPTGSEVVVKVGGVRAGDTPGALDGVVLGLFENADDAAPVAECTSTGGACTFTVPGTDGTTRFWIKEVRVPDGWFSNPALHTGEGTGEASQADPYVFRTPPLEPGGTYTSGAEFMAQGGRADRAASGGYWQVSRDNVPLPQRCGLDVALLLDTSGSVEDELPELKQAADTITDSLVGTPSQMALFSFSSSSPAERGENHPGPVPVTTPEQADAFKALYRDWAAEGGTNWDVALDTVAGAGAHYDLVLMITDGAPTFYRNEQGPGDFTRFRETEEAVFSANLLKEKGSRLVVAGVGDGIDTETELNLRAVTGPVEFDGSNMLEADYLHTGDFGAVGEAIREMVGQMCSGSLSVTKMIVPEGNGEGDLSGAVPAGPGWTFDAGTGTEGAAVDPASATTGDDGTGTVNFALAYPHGAESAVVEITERQRDGYRLVPQDGETARCVELTGEGGGEPLDVESRPGDDPAFAVSVPAAAPVNCTVYNQKAPDPPADLTVDKSWWIDGLVYPEGEQPDGFGSALSLADGEALTPQPWGEARGGYPAGGTVAGQEVMTAPEQCSLVLAEARPAGEESPFDGLGPGAEGTREDGYREDFGFALSAEHNRYTVYNAFTCDTRLTLVKEVDNTGGGTAGPGDWTLTAAGDGGTVSGPGGGPAVTGAAVVPGDYELGEAGPEGYTAGPWSCRAEGSDEELATGGTVEVGPGEHVTCRVLNTFVPGPGPGPSPSPSPSPSPTPSPSPSPGEEPSPSPEPGGPGPRPQAPDGPPDRGGLPVTGTPVLGAVAAAALLIAAGVISLFLVRRRPRTEG